MEYDKSSASTHLLADQQPEPRPAPVATTTAYVSAPAQQQQQQQQQQQLPQATATAVAQPYPQANATATAQPYPQATATATAQPYPQATATATAQPYPATATDTGGVPQQQYAPPQAQATAGGPAGAPPPVAEALPVVGDGNDINTFEDKNSLHIRSLVLSILVWIGLLLFIIAAATNQAFFEDGSPTGNRTNSVTGTLAGTLYNYYYNYYYHSHHSYYADYYRYGGHSSGQSCGSYSSPFLCGASYLFPVFFGLYFLESFVMVCDSCVKCKLGSSTCRYVSNIKSDSSSERFIAQLHREDPQFRMNVVCYHYETRSRRVSYTDGNGNTRYRTEYYQEKVVTHRATGWIQYDHWMDCSTSVCGLGIHPLVKMELSKSYQYADELTAQEFERQRINFRAVNDLDVHQDYSETYIIRGYEQYALCCRHGEKPKFLGVGGYFLASILLMTWAYRRWVEVMCLFTRIRIRKRVSCSPAPAILIPLIGAFGQQRDLLLCEAIVYQQMYNTPFPSASVEVQEMATQAIGIDVPQATYAGAEVCVK